MKKRSKKISVVISGMTSVGKTTAADAIAKKFHLRHVAGGDMLKLMAYERGYKPSGSEWWDTKEGMKFLSERERNQDFDKEVDRRLSEFLKKGGVVITSYPAPWLCDAGLKLWFHASQKTRAKRLGGRDNITSRKALNIVKKRDVANKKLYKNLYGIRFGDDLSPFNFILDTERMSATEVAKISCKLVSEYSKDI
ncbi:MAG TPA: cytidylate kinase family protein [Nitrososphaerales archaeon]|nr:cytidylate kinase family protein [Nitrososphaerales archaeon]